MQELRLGLNIKYLMTKKGISRETIAELLDVTPQQVSHYISGRNEPPLDKIQKLSGIFEVPVQELLFSDTITIENSNVNSAKNIKGNNNQVINSGADNKDQIIKDLEKENEGLKRELKDKTLIIELLQGKSAK